MCAMQETIALVIPCFNEAQRLDLEAFRKRHAKLWLFFVDDGSHDGTAELIERQLCGEGVFLLRLPQNRGKAAAVRAGMLHIESRSDLPRFDWIGYWDADLATPLSEVAPMVSFARSMCPEASFVMGSRIKRGGASVERRVSRHLLGRLFCTIVALSLDLNQYYDTQCGAKLLRPELISRLFSRPFISPWLFDLELLLSLKPREALEYPLQAWEEKPGSKLRIFRSALRLGRDLWKIRRARPKPEQAFASEASL